MIRVNSIQISGFRGIREQLDLTFSPGFTVLTGTNGAGKSSILDAIEFALSGNISKYEEGSGEKGEKSSAYEWWRGSKPAKDRFVRLSIANDEGQSTLITRTPEGLTIEGGTSLLDLLCDRAVNPDSSLDELCRTSIIRDEFIAKNSVDLPETDRFSFVKDAVGGTSTVEMEAKLSEALKLLKTRSEDAQREYERIRRQVQDRIETLSAARGQAAQVDLAANAEARLRQALTTSPGTIEELIVAADREMRQLRNQADILGSLLSRARIVEDRRRSLESSGALKRKTALSEQIEALNADYAASEIVLADSNKVLETLQEGQSFISNLAQLHQAGAAIGLLVDRCPLCGSTLDAASFQRHLDSVAAEVAAHGTQIAAAVDRQRECRGQEQRIRGQLDEARASLDRIQSDIDAVQSQIQSFQAEVDEVSPQYSGFSIDSLQSELQKTRDRLSEIDQNRRMIAVADQTDKIVDLERDLETARAAGASAERQIAKIRRIEDQIKEGIATLKRLGSEAVEERLAAIKPLFTELYLRLRPHIDWKNVNYAVRGDLRKFLSLRVDEDLNLKFLFSSGQRRATGLAFLISVALSRPWCRFRTLVLDDPIQHVDDFRAVHLVETLAAIRSMKYQLICAVEDPALADLLSRRLRSSYRDGGKLVKMKYVSGEGAGIHDERDIAPFEMLMLSTAS
jgi:chromosome segregation protein